ncbi:MAG: Yip1 family protein [Chloroflexota bacterium]
MEEIQKTQQNARNPFISIWIRPRDTIRQIVDADPEKHIYFLAAISGIYRVLESATDRSFGDTMPLSVILLLSLVLGAFGGVLGLNIGAVLFRWSGKLFGGTADFKDVRAALAWSSVPDIILLAVYIPMIAIFGHDLFTSSTDWIDASALIIIGILAIVGFILIVWRAVMFIKCLAEVHRFSAWKSLAATIIGFLVIVLPFFIIIFGTGAFG